MRNSYGSWKWTNAQAIGCRNSDLKFHISAPATVIFTEAVVWYPLTNGKSLRVLCYQTVEPSIPVVLVWTRMVKCHE